VEDRRSPQHLGCAPSERLTRIESVTLAHYAEAVFSEEGRCWRFISSPDGTGRPTFCPEPVMLAGTTRLKGGRRIRVWSCDGHREGIEKPALVS